MLLLFPVVSSNLGKFHPLVIQIFFGPPLPLLWDSNHMHFRLFKVIPQLTDILFIFWILFSLLCFPLGSFCYWIKFINLFFFCPVSSTNYPNQYIFLLQFFISRNFIHIFLISSTSLLKFLNIYNIVIVIIIMSLSSDSNIFISSASVSINWFFYYGS